MTGQERVISTLPAPHHTHTIGGRDRMATRQSISERFWSKVDRRGPDECWPWLGSKNQHGRGDFYWSSEIIKITAPRASWWLTHGEMPAQFVCHTCDNPSCCNPAHFFLGDHRANAQDAIAKGRFVFPPIQEIGQKNFVCKRGHAISGGNLLERLTKGGLTLRRCKDCYLAGKRRYEARIRAARRAAKAVA